MDSVTLYKVGEPLKPPMEIKTRTNSSKKERKSPDLLVLGPYLVASFQLAPHLDRYFVPL